MKEARFDCPIDFSNVDAGANITGDESSQCPLALPTGFAIGPADSLAVVLDQEVGCFRLDWVNVMGGLVATAWVLPGSVPDAAVRTQPDALLVAWYRDARRPLRIPCCAPLAASLAGMVRQWEWLHPLGPGKIVFSLENVSEAGDEVFERRELRVRNPGTKGNATQWEFFTRTLGSYALHYAAGRPGRGRADPLLRLAKQGGAALLACIDSAPPKPASVQRLRRPVTPRPVKPVVPIYTLTASFSAAAFIVDFIWTEVGNPTHQARARFKFEEDGERLVCELRQPEGRVEKLPSGGTSAESFELLRLLVRRLPILLRGLRCERIDTHGVVVDFSGEITAENALNRINDELQAIRELTLDRAAQKRDDALWARGIDPGHVDLMALKKEKAAIRAKEKVEAFRAAREAELRAREEARAKSASVPNSTPPAKAKMSASSRVPPAPPRPPLLPSVAAPKVAFTFNWPVFPTEVASAPCTSLERVRLRESAALWWVSNQSDDLLCLPYCRVQRLDYQVRTALRALGPLQGRALLSDEVGLGKTIEAGLIAKELFTRGMVRRLLVLTLPSLVDQWEEELAEKFDLVAATTNHAAFASDPAAFWRGPSVIVASLHTFKLPVHLAEAGAVAWDLVIVDEAHYLRKRESQAWQAVNQLKRQFMLMLTATPVQNSLEELYNLVTLLKPGQLPSPKEFRARFLDPKQPRQPRDPEELRRLLGQVMIRNTRANSGLVLPPRRAETVLFNPPPAELAQWNAWGGELRVALTALPAN